MVRLRSLIRGPNRFELFVLGKTPRDNERLIKLGNAEQKVKAIKFFVRGDRDLPFQFQIKNEVAIFEAHPNGEWQVAITPDMTLASKPIPDTPYYLKVACREAIDYVPIVRRSVNLV